MKTQSEVFDFLLSVDPEQSIISFAEGLVNIANTGETSKKIVAQAIDAVHNYLENQNRPFISEKGMKEYLKTKTRTNGYSIKDVPDFYQTLVSILYLKTKSIFATAPKDLLNNLQKDLEGLPAKLQKLNSTFFEDLLVETETRASKYPSFANTLDEALKEISHQMRSVEQLKDSIIPVLLRRRAGSGPSCIITVHDSQGNVSQIPIYSWWVCLLIFLGIIVMIILAI